MTKTRHNIGSLKTGTITGILFCLALAVPAWLLGKAFPIIGGPVFAILFGIVISTAAPQLVGFVCRDGSGISSGIRFTSKTLLQLSIILLGFEMNLFNVVRVGGQSLFVMLFTLAAAFLTMFLAGRALRLSGNTTTLIGVGTAICGGSAIAATAPVIGAKDEEVARSISTIFLFNIAAVFIFPALGHAMNMSDMSFGMWAGTAINDTSSVVAAGTAWSEVAGNNTALEFATIVKLTRTLMIVPITLFLAVYTARRRGAEGNSGFRFAKVFPWFVLLFVAAAVANTFLPIPTAASAFLAACGKFLIVMAMAAIGLNTSLKSLMSSGIRPIVLGLACWAAVALTSLAVQYITGV